jgi:hypothetical protein
VETLAIWFVCRWSSHAVTRPQTTRTGGYTPAYVSFARGVGRRPT